jgi:hypothetical protein
VCDSCGDLVTAEENSGIVVWRTDRSDDGNKDFDFKIVHKSIQSDPEPRLCDPGARRGYVSNLPLSVFLGPDGLAMLLSWLSIGPLRGGGQSPRVADMDEFVSFVRRVQTPYYEEARFRFADEDTRQRLDDANEYYPYVPETLRRIAEGDVR